MSISAISGSSGYSSSLYTQNSTKKRPSAQDDPMTQAISSLQSTDPTLASKLGDMQKQVEAMKKSGASEDDIQKTVKTTMDGLSATEKSELKSAMAAPPSGASGRAGGHGGHGGPPPAGGPPPSNAADSGASSTSLSASSLLDSLSSAQNDTIAGLLSARSSSYATVQ